MSSKIPHLVIQRRALDELGERGVAIAFLLQMKDSPKKDELAKQLFPDLADPSVEKTLSVSRIVSKIGGSYDELTGGRPKQRIKMMIGGKAVSVDMLDSRITQFATAIELSRDSADVESAYERLDLVGSAGTVKDYLRRLDFHTIIRILGLNEVFQEEFQKVGTYPTRIAGDNDDVKLVLVKISDKCWPSQTKHTVIAHFNSTIDRCVDKYAGFDVDESLSKDFEKVGKLVKSIVTTLDKMMAVKIKSVAIDPDKITGETLLDKSRSILDLMVKLKPKLTKVEITYGYKARLLVDAMALVDEYIKLSETGLAEIIKARIATEIQNKKSKFYRHGVFKLELFANSLKYGRTGKVGE